MKNSSSSSSNMKSLYFQFTLFTDQGSLRYLFFSLCLLLYMTIVSANLAIILAVCLEKSLHHQPMYIFICCLSCNSLYGSVGFFPRFLMDVISDTHLIPQTACFIQIYIIYSYLGNELTLLTVMAYDRLVAICQPLHYHRKMTGRKVACLIFVSWLYPAFNMSVCVYKVSRIPLCGNKLNRVFCTNWPVVQLSCEDTTVMNILGGVSSVVSVSIPLTFVLFTYLRILLVCRRSSSEFRGKALQTCVPHIVTFVNYCVTVFCEMSLTRYKVTEKNTLFVVVLSLECLIVPPINNPLVYGLSLPQIRGVIFRGVRVFRKVSAGKQKIHREQEHLK
ncbi:olfactory receptor 10J5-like [Xyrichtys novacula]|uniref:Olfactory receptor 10J5-like n=1 Tax=Xyrichtys novacula TaxID=13765 RepID=A0AAV1GXN5_XYRNO|nr:olfactory receptor 10J5-like [Xyrichtys novacula]